MQNTKRNFFWWCRHYLSVPPPSLHSLSPIGQTPLPLAWWWPLNHLWFFWISREVFCWEIHKFLEIFLYYFWDLKISGNFIGIFNIIKKFLAKWKKNLLTCFPLWGEGQIHVVWFSFFGWVGRVVKHPTIKNLLAKRGTLRDPLT